MKNLVLLPAMLCDEELYADQIGRLGGLVESSVAIATKTSMAENAAAVLRSAPARFILAGTSYGASLALEIVATAPARVAGLWLMGCNPGLPGDALGATRLSERVRAGEFDTVVEELARRTIYAHGPHASAAGAVFRRMAHRMGAEVFLNQNQSLLGRRDLRSQLSDIECPTFVLWGRQDEFARVAHGSFMASRIRQASFLVLDDCGHLPTIEKPAAVTDAVRAWLKAV